MLDLRESAESKFFKNMILPIIKNYHMTFFAGSCVAFIMSFCYYLGVIEVIPDNKLSLMDLALNDYFNIMPVTLFYILITVFVSVYVAFLIFQLTNYISKFRIYMRKYTKVSLKMKEREERIVEICFFISFLTIVFYFLFIRQYTDLTSFVTTQIYITSASITFYFFLKTKSELVINSILENISLLFLIIMLANVAIILPREMGIQQYSTKIKKGILCPHSIKTDIQDSNLEGTLIIKLTDLTIYRDCGTSVVKTVYTKNPYIETKL